jgi:predicted metal-dependent hydrolase
VTARPGTILQGGRAKAYRPLPPDERRRAFESAVAAYQRGDFFEAHELLEPAWMGSADAGERNLDQGLIKLAAAYVHGVRGNPAGIAKNLVGARERLAESVGTDAVAGAGVDVVDLIAQIDQRLGASPDDLAASAPPTIRRSAR